MRKLSVILIGGAVVAAAVAAGPQNKSKLTADDYAEIHNLYARYNYAYDSSNAEMYGGVFTTDGEFVVGDRVLHGRKEIGDLTKGRGAVKSRPKIFHVGSSVVVDPSPEGAKGSSYVVLMDLQKNPAISGGGVYEDVLVKTKEGWRFKKRSYFAEP